MKKQLSSLLYGCIGILLLIGSATAHAQSGNILREVWWNVDGDKVSSLTNESSFPYQPSLRQYITSFDYKGGSSQERYGARISGYLYAPTTGYYTFWISSDNNSELYLSTNESPGEKRLIASVQSYTGYREWNKFPSQQSSVIKLAGGHRYYIEVLHKEGGSDDHVSVGWQLPSGTLERPILGNRLAAYSPPLKESSGPLLSSKGTLTRELWKNVLGSTVADLQASSSYPFSPTLRDSISTFSMGDLGIQNFGQRIRGYVIPPASGFYAFWISSDDQSELYLSTNHEPANKRLIAKVPQWTRRYEWEKYPAQRALQIWLNQGDPYYIEVVHKDQTSGDHVEVGWKLPNGTVERPILGNRIAPYLTGPTVSPTPAPTGTPRAMPTGTPSGEGFTCLDPQSVDPYRSSLTSDEVQHLLSRALGGSPELRQIGLNKGKDALIAALFSQSDADAETLGNAFAKAEYRSGDGRTDLWSPESARNYWLTYMTRGNRLREAMTLHLHNWFPVNIRRFEYDGQRNHYIKQYLLHLRSQAFGNFRELLMSMFTDGGMSVYLNNRYNSVGRNNYDMARELQELFTLDTYDRVTGTKQYSEQDVLNIGKSITGYAEVCSSTRCEVKFDPSRFDSSVKTIYPNLPGQSQKNFDASGVVNRILDDHPGAARYIAFRLFTLLVHDHPSDQTVEDLAQDLVTQDYDLKAIVWKLLSSCAMFSKDSYKRYFTGPVEHLTQFVNSLDLPVDDPDTLKEMRLSLRDGLQNILEYPSIFGVQTGGLTGGEVNEGELSLSPQVQLEMSRATTKLLNSIKANKGWFSFTLLLPSGDRSAGRVIDHFTDILRINLSSTEKTLLLGYMNSRNVSGTNQIVLSQEPWNPDAPSEAKIAGLLEILSQHPDNRRQ